MTGESYFLDRNGNRVSGRRDNFNINEVLDAVIPGFNKTAQSVQQGVQDAQATIAFLERNKFKLIFAVFAAMVLASVIANKITG